MASRRRSGCPLGAWLVITATVATALLAAVPLSAGASTATTEEGRLVYRADEPEANRVSISKDTEGYLIEDLGAVIAPEIGCTRVDARRVRCSAEGIEGVTVELDNGNDTLTVADSAYPPAPPTDGSAQLLALGGEGRDELRGGAGQDTLDGEGENDILAGAGGDDRLAGGDGDDTLASAGGDDALFGGNGDDTLDAGPGDDNEVLGQHGDDRVAGGPGNDSVRGNEGADTVDGDQGDDGLQGGPGNDLVRGGDGNDRLDFPSILSMVGGPEPTAGADTLDGGLGDDMLNGGPSPPADGGPQDGDRLEGDMLLGDGGNDTADYSQRTEHLIIDLDGDADDGESGEGDNVESDVERVIGGSNADTLTGSNDANFVDGRDGEDTIDGRGGDDTLLGGVNDPSGDNLSGGSGSDTLSGGPGDDAVVGGAGDDGALGGGGGDRVDGEGGNDALSGGAGADAVDGGDGDDSLNGGDVILIGGDGPDELIGGPGADVLRGGRGKDRLDGGLGPDLISGESEKDTVTYEDRTSKVVVTLDGHDNDGEAGEHDNVLPDVEVILGGLVGDDLSGDADGNTVDGGRGEDFIDGDLDPDRLLGGDAPDIVWARDGAADEVACGDAGDLAIADVRDKLLDCETIDRPGARRLIVGRYARVRPRGEFRLRLPQGRRFFPLTAEVKIPIGSTIDPEAGVVRLTTARNRTGGRQVASVSAGRFTVRQQRGRRTVTTLRLAGRLPDCPRSSTRRGKAKAAAGPSRKLHVNVKNRRARKKTRRVNYRVRGRYSIGGSYGTAWTTEDRCDGTLTTVLSGTVRVRDFGRGRTVTVRQGLEYLAAR